MDQTAMLWQLFNEGRKITAAFENGEASYEKTKQRIEARKIEREVSKAATAMAIAATRIGDERTYKKMVRTLIGSGKQQLQIELKEKIYDRTAERGH